MVTTAAISEAIGVTTIMVRQRITDKEITTDVAIETIIIVIKKIIAKQIRLFKIPGNFLQEFMSN